MGDEEKIRRDKFWKLLLPWQTASEKKVTPETLAKLDVTQLVVEKFSSEEVRQFVE